MSSRSLGVLSLLSLQPTYEGLKQGLNELREALRAEFAAYLRGIETLFDHPAVTLDGEVCSPPTRD